MEEMTENQEQKKEMLLHATGENEPIVVLMVTESTETCSDHINRAREIMERAEGNASIMVFMK